MPSDFKKIDIIIMHFSCLRMRVAQLLDGSNNVSAIDAIIELVTSVCNVYVNNLCSELVRFG